VTPAQLPPAATPASRQPHRPLLHGPGGPSSPPWLATAGPAPPPTARCRASDTQGQRGCRTAGRGCGRPGSANRRSAGCTDRVVGLGPTGTGVALTEPRAGRDRDLPGPAGLPAAHRCHRPWPGCQAPTNPPSRRARPGRSRIVVSPYSCGRSGSPDMVWGTAGGPSADPRSTRPSTQGGPWPTSMSGCGTADAPANRSRPVAQHASCSVDLAQRPQ